MGFFDISEDHIASGVACARTRFGYAPDPALIRDLARSVQTLRSQGRLFHEALRETLTLHHVTDPGLREACKSALGKVFGLRRKTHDAVKKTSTKRAARSRTDDYTPWKRSTRDRLVFYSGMRAAARERHDDDLPDP